MNLLPAMASIAVCTISNSQKTFPPRRSRIARLLFCDSLPFWGGGEHWIVQVGEQLRARGWEVTIAGRHGAELLKRADRAGLPIVAWPFSRDFDLATIRAASRWLRDNRPDVVLVTTGRDIRSLGIAAKRRGIPVVWRMGPKPKDNLVHRITGALITHVIAPSETVRRELQPFPWLRNKITVVPNGIAIRPRPTSEEVAAARMLLGLPPSTFLCLYVGRLMRGKGIDVLIDGFVDVHNRHREAALWIVGAGPDEASARALVAKHELTGIVSFVGYSDDPSIYFTACDLFVLPSRYESFSYVLLEAMLHGKPCVTTRAGAIPEVVGDRGAKLIATDDPVQLAEAISELITDTALRTELANAGHHRVVDNFDLNKTVDQVETLFRSTIKGAQ